MLIFNKKLVSSAFLCSVVATGLISSLKAGAQNAGQPIGPDALWGPGMSIMQMIRQDCASAGTQFGKCFANGMQKSGASPQAVAFTHMTDDTGYMRDFRQTGRVSIAYINFPFRANENQGAYLVNGSPAMIDIDNQSLLAQNQLATNPTYTKLAKKYPEITLFPGDRDGTSYLVAVKQSSGGQRFIVPYNLQNQCHACEQVSTAKFAFDFDPAGKFLGTKLLGVTVGATAGSETKAQTTPPTSTPPASTYQPGYWQPVARVNPQSPVTVTLINNAGVNLKYNFLDEKGEVDLPAGSSKQLSSFALPADLAIYNPANIERLTGLSFNPSPTNNNLQITIQSVPNDDDGVVNLSQTGAIYIY